MGESVDTPEWLVGVREVTFFAETYADGKCVLCCDQVAKEGHRLSVDKDRAVEALSFFLRVLEGRPSKQVSGTRVVLAEQIIPPKFLADYRGALPFVGERGTVICQSKDDPDLIAVAFDSCHVWVKNRSLIVLEDGGDAT